MTSRIILIFFSNLLNLQHFRTVGRLTMTIHVKWLTNSANIIASITLAESNLIQCSLMLILNVELIRQQVDQNVFPPLPDKLEVSEVINSNV